MISPSSARPDTDSQPVTAVDLFVRSLSPDGDAGHAEAIVERLADIPDSVGVTVRVWGEAVGLDGPLATTEPRGSFSTGSRRSATGPSPTTPSCSGS